MRKIYIITFLIAILFSSCENKSNKDDGIVIAKKPKYEFQLLEIDDQNSFYFVLDKNTGRVFISKNNASWYEATHESPLPKMDLDSYTITVKKESTPKGIVPKIILFNQVTSEVYVYIVDNVANFYSAMSPFDNLQ